MALKKIIFFFTIFILINSSLSLDEKTEVIDIGVETLEELYQNVSGEYMESVYKDLYELIDSYAYLDILKSPPAPYIDSKVDIKELIENIDITEDLPFYEFYRNIKKIFSNTRDIMFDILANVITLQNKTISMQNYELCLPFKFYLDNKSNEPIKMYIKEMQPCSRFYSQQVQQFIKEHKEVALEEINGQDPFDFIQNFLKDFYNMKNPNSDFSFKLESISNLKLVFNPISLEEINVMNLTFNNQDILTTHFHLIRGNKPYNLKSSNEEVAWTLRTRNGQFKCRVDDINHLNVFYLNSLSMQETELEVLVQCAQLFYQNEYKIVGITNQVWEGDNLYAYILAQILNPKIDIKFNFAMRQSKLNKQYFELNKNKFLNAETCAPIESWEDFIEETPDKYDNIEHKRTKIYNPIPKNILFKVQELREAILSQGKDKKSTDILILTDRIVYGAASNFIKTLQNNGGAIIASYAGRPDISDDGLDASLDPCDITNYEGIDIYKSLLEKGFKIYTFPFAESFQYVKGNDIPLTFKVNEIDKRTEIYHNYEDNYYNEFISQAINILNKYDKQNLDSNCSKKNPNLIYEDNTCTFEGDTHAHGGYSCNEGKWGTKCEKSYCDVGYYLDKKDKMCKSDPCNYEMIDLNEQIELNKTISPDKTYIFKLNTNLYAYVFNSTEDDIIQYNYDTKMTQCSRICAIKDKNVNYIYVNYNHNLKKEIQMQINSIKAGSLNIISYKFDSPKMSMITPMSGTSIYIFELTQDNYMYIDSYDKSFKFFYTQYNNIMTISDIININEKYFYSDYGKIMPLAKDNIYIGIFVETVTFSKIYIYNSLPEHIELEEGLMPILYLENSKRYELDFTGLDDLPYMIRLHSFGNEIIEVTGEGDHIATLTSTNKYYKTINEVYRGKLYLEIKNGNALVDVIYSNFDNYTEVLDSDEINEHEISKEITLIEYKNKEQKIMEIEIQSDYEFSFNAYAGLTKENYFYLSGSLYYPMKSYHITLNNVLNGITLEEGEKYYLSLMFKKLTENQKIKVSYHYVANPIDDLYEDLTEEYVQKVKDNLVSIIKNYVFSDIAKNPPKLNLPEDYVHEPIDFTKTINSVQTSNRKFYEFYSEIRKILGTVRDLHFRIYGQTTPQGIQFKYMYACLPFNFYVDGDSKENAKLYIKKFQDCYDFYNDDIKSFIKEKIDKNIPLSKINGEDAFIYLQKWGREFRGTKSPHGHFTMVKNVIHAFPLYIYPYTPDKLTLDLEFDTEENKQIKLNFYIYIPNIPQLNKLYSSKDSNEDEFDKFYEEELSKYKDNINIPNIFDIIKKYKKKKGILTEEKVESKYDWKYSTPEENGIKCRIDDEHHLNVILQGSFSLARSSALEVIINCTEEFYKNNYEIVVIENFNGGGDGIVSLAMSQFLQVKILNKMYMATNQYFKKTFSYYNFQNGFIDVETCKPFYDIEKAYQGQINDYSSEDEIIIHNKSKIMDWLDKDSRKYLENYRQKYYEYNHLKKPTDIIIFTDSFAYSATSVFTKGLQNTGGAIIVGFNGNPKLSDDLFDASQSPSPVFTFEESEEYNNLLDLGFLIDGITYAETFDVDYPNNKSIPREYLFDPIDERVNIFEAYDDDKYDQFMEEAKRIFKKYNEEGKCNPKNKKLLLENDTQCYDLNDADDKYSHGGYECSDDGTWSNTCKKYYCDLGYYYNSYEDKCVRDICTNDEGEKDITLNGQYEETIVLNSSNNLEYVFYLNNSDYIYIFQESEKGYIYYEGNVPCTSICVLQKGVGYHNNKVHLNYYRNATNKEITIKVYSLKNFKGIMQSIILESGMNQLVLNPDNKIIIITETIVDYIAYFKTFDKSLKVFNAVYQPEMKISDIVDINPNFFSDISNQIFEMTPGKLYILAAKSEISHDLVQFLLQPKLYNRAITIPSDVTPLNLYLSNKVSEYSINFQNNKRNIMAQLSKVSPSDCEITITDNEGKELTKLNPSNEYYSFDNINAIFNGIIKLKVTKGDDALIELLYEIDVNQYEIISEKEVIDHPLTKPPIIKLNQHDKDRNIHITISSKTEKKFSYSLASGYSKGNYFIYPMDIPPFISGEHTYDIEIFKKAETFENGESFYLFLYINRTVFLSEDYQITISKNETDINDVTPDDKSSSEDSGLKDWHISLIVVGSVLVLVLIGLIIYKLVLSKKHDDSDQIGSLIDNKNDMRELAEKN